MSIPRKSSTILATLLLFALAAAPAPCRTAESPAAGRTFRYRITSRGFGVGELTTSIAAVPHKGGRALRFQSDLAIDANLLFFKKVSRSREDALVNEQGTLSYRKHGEENGRRGAVEASLEGGSFRFRVTDGAGERQLSVPRGSYDCTTMDCPETSLRREGERMELRLLDLGLATVVTRRFHYLKNEEVVVGARTIRCKVVEFSDPNNSCRRWVSSDEEGVIIVRQDGSGKGGTYSLRLVLLTESP